LSYRGIGINEKKEHGLKRKARNERRQMEMGNGPKEAPNKWPTRPDHEPHPCTGRSLADFAKCSNIKI